MAQTVYQWEVYCLTSQSYQLVWDTVEPVTCPENASHSISTNPGPRIVNKISQEQVKITEEEALPTQGIYKFRGYKMTIPSGTVGAITSLNVTWNYPVTLMNGCFVSTTEMVGDEVNVWVAPNTTIGAIGAPVNISDTEITVTSTVFDNLYRGWTVNITNGVTNNILGECIDMDVGNSTITCETGATNTFSPLSPTYVQMTPKLVDNCHIVAAGVRFPFAEKKIGGRSIPAGRVMQIRYTNNTTASKSFVFFAEYLY
jgi:hypothetical protein